MKTNKDIPTFTENIMPLTTNFLINNCSKRIKSRYDTLADDIIRYNKSVLAYNRKIKAKNDNLVKNKKIVKKVVSKAKKINNANMQINKYNDEIEEKNNKIERDNKKAKNKQNNNEYVQFKEKELKMTLSYSRVLPTNIPLISDIINNVKNKNNKYFINGSAIREKEDEYGIFSVLKFDKKKDIIFGKEDEIKKYLPQLHLCILLDLINNEDKIKQDFLEIYPKLIYEYNDNNYMYKIKNFNFDDMLCEFIPYSISSTYLKIIPEGMNINSIQNYYGIIPDSKNSYEAKKIMAINYLYSCQEYSGVFDQIFLEYIKKDFFIKKENTKNNSERKGKSVNNPFNDKFFEKDFIIPKIIPFLIDKFYQKDSLGIRVKNIIISDISKSREMIESYESGDKFSEMYKEVNKVSSTYAYELSKIQEKYLYNPQILDSDILYDC